jgi:hypothetical protein
VSWLDRTRGDRSAGDKEDDQDPDDAPVARKSPGLARLFEGLHDDGRHSVLDLGPADGRQLRLLGRFGRQLRFAGLVPREKDDTEWLESVRRLPAHPRHPYDVVLLWDLLDRLPAEDRRPVMERLAKITAPDARLYTVVDASSAATVRPRLFRMVDLDRVTQVATGPPEPAGKPLLPAHVERALKPFQVIHAFTLRGGLREYVAKKTDREDAAED